MTWRRRTTRSRPSLATPGRVLAASILAASESGRRLDVAWEASGAGAAPDRAWIRNLVYGTVRLRGRIDHVLATVAGRDVEQLDPPVRTLLRMGAYQILEMDSVPSYAAVSESVSQMKATHGRGAAGLINAVLRRVAESGPAEWRFPDPDASLEDHLSTWGSHPRWLVRRWIRHFGADGARRLAAANNLEPVTYVRPLGSRSGMAAQALSSAGFLASRSSADAAGAADAADLVDPASGCLPLRPGADPAAALQIASGVIQDPAASLVADYAAPGAESVVLDLCAAPGGKALVLAGKVLAREAGAGAVLAADLSPARMKRVVQGVRRLGLESRVWPLVADARRPPVRNADMVLADVPCSGTGTLRRHPDGRWRVTEDTIARLAAVQRQILEGAASVVPVGGLLVYATCTLEPEENWNQVSTFLERHPQFRIEAGPVAARFLDERGCLAILPHESGFDGAFAARMRKIAA